MQLGRGLPRYNFYAKQIAALTHARVHNTAQHIYLIIFMYMVEYAKLTTLFFSLM